MSAEVLIADGADSPLSAAIGARDRDTLRMVEAAVTGRNAMLAFQPVVLAARPDRPAFYEGLIRILDDTGRVIPAREFIGAVEMHPVGRMIDCLALEMGIAALKATPTLRLAINLSARSIGFARWQRALDEGLRADPTVGERLILEITEASAMVMPDVVQAFMADLQVRGISFAIDDFGAGFTSFRHLRDMYFDILKIDGQFIRGIATNGDNRVMTQALLSIARHFGMLTVAESVETAEDAAWLTAAGVDCLQGYHFGVPARRPTFVACAPRRRTG
ncbi:EAL domain-containing protein [Palleronia sp. KMU-117]|uniref:EAL domain-containing protein n=1 Tax=Palleronia sp. KMU-117 TaxID=3434108 RepID=UPI003D752216